jgi:hypothetical protein
MAEATSTPKRIFSYDEAAALLPEVRRLTEHAFQSVEALSGLAAHDRDEARARVDEIVTGWARGLLERGLAIKGLWLVDFDNGSGYYCWRYPEEGLQYYHGYEEGFQGRIRIH